MTQKGEVADYVNFSFCQYVLKIHLLQRRRKMSVCGRVLGLENQKSKFNTKLIIFAPSICLTFRQTAKNPFKLGCCAMFSKVICCILEVRNNLYQEKGRFVNVKLIVFGCLQQEPLTGKRVYYQIIY